MLEQLSYSSLSTFAKCPEQFKRVKVDEIEGGTRTPENARGNIMHRWLEEVVQTRIDYGTYPTEDWTRARLDEIWHDGYIDEQTGLNPLLEVEWDDEFLVRSYEQGIKLVPKIYKFLETVVPIAAEQHLTINLPFPGKEIKRLHGYVDIIAAPNIIIDWKTRNSPANDRWVGVDLQATVYTALSGLPRATVNFVQLVLPKKDSPRLIVTSTKRDERHVDWLLNEHIPSVIRVIEGNTFTANPGWQCYFCPVPCGAAPDLMVGEIDD